MSAPANQATRAERADPQPPGEPGERKRWHRLGRGRGMPGPAPLVSVEVDFDRSQSDWLTEEAARSGLDYVQLLKALVDRAREAGRNGRAASVSE